MKALKILRGDLQSVRMTMVSNFFATVRPSLAAIYKDKTIMKNIIIPAIVTFAFLSSIIKRFCMIRAF